MAAVSLREDGNDCEYFYQVIKQTPNHLVMEDVGTPGQHKFGAAVCSLSGEMHFEVAVLECPYAGAGCPGCDGGVKEAMAALRRRWRNMSWHFKCRKLAFKDVTEAIRKVLGPGPGDHGDECKDPDSLQVPHTDSFRERHRIASDAIGEFDHAIRLSEEEDVLSEGEPL
jgi:hypothetical protein